MDLLVTIQEMLLCCSLFPQNTLILTWIQAYLFDSSLFRMETQVWGNPHTLVVSYKQ